MNAPDGTGKTKKKTLQNTARKNAKAKAKTLNKGKAKVVNSGKSAAKKAVAKSKAKAVNKTTKAAGKALKNAAKKAVKKATKKKTSNKAKNNSKPKNASKKNTPKKSSNKKGKKKASSKKASTKKAKTKLKASKKTKQQSKKLPESKLVSGKAPDNSDIAIDNTSANDAVSKLSGNVINNSQMQLFADILGGLKVNDLDSYVSSRLRNDFIRDRGEIQSVLDRATNAAFDVQRMQALRDAANAENTNYRNTQNTIAEMRRNLIGSASSGANVGAANATALQALLGLGQQNTDVTTEGLQNINNISRERAAQLAQNAADAIDKANDATSKMYDAATSAYGSDRSYAAQGAAEALGNITSTALTNYTNDKMNRDTLANNLAVQKLVNAGNLAVQKATNKGNVKTAKVTGKYSVKAAKASR